MPLGPSIRALAACLALLDGAPRRPPTGLPAVHVEERRLGELYLVQARFRAPAPAETVWEVITAYEALPGFISSIRRSEVVERDGARAEVDQEVRAHVLFLTRDVRLRLRIEETPPSHVDFRDVSGVDFKAYSGSWDVVPWGEETELVYRLRIIPKEALPGAVGEGALRAGAQRLLEELRSEILRRVHALAPTPTRSTP